MFKAAWFGGMLSYMYMVRVVLILQRWFKIFSISFDQILSRCAQRLGERTRMLWRNPDSSTIGSYTRTVYAITKSLQQTVYKLAETHAFWTIPVERCLPPSRCPQIASVEHWILSIKIISPYPSVPADQIDLAVKVKPRMYIPSKIPAAEQHC